MSDIDFPERMKQLVDFKNLHFGEEGNKRPTDIDICFELQNKVFIFVEIKKTGVPFETGQRLVYERLCNFLMVPSIALLARHDTPLPEPVDAASCSVESFWKRGFSDWKKPLVPINVREAMDRFLDTVGIELKK